MKDRQPKVAIIIPVYNVEKYLPECLSSITNQIFKNFTAFIINDGSTDKSLDIVRKWTTQDPRFIYFCKQNGGLSSARNFILDKIFQDRENTFDYITFIDSDDIVDENYLSDLVQVAQKHNCDLTICEHLRFSSSLSLTKNQHQKNIKEEQLTREEFLKAILSVGKWKSIPIQGTVWGKIYKTELIKNIRFPDDVIEDEPFNISVICNLDNDKIFYISKKNYFYRDNPTSLTKKPDSLTKLVRGRILSYKIAYQAHLPQLQLDIILLQMARTALQSVFQGDLSITKELKTFQKDILLSNKRQNLLSFKSILRLNIVCNHKILTKIYLAKRALWDKIRYAKKKQLI